MVRVHIADKNIKLVERIRLSIDKSNVCSVDHVSHKLKECKERLARHTPNVLILGLAFPDGIGVDFCAAIRREYPHVKILMLTDDNEYSITRRVMDEGASGFIQKNALPEEFVFAIDTIVKGKYYLGGKIGMEKESRQKESPPEWLKPLERSLPEWLGKNCSRREAIDKLTRMIEFLGNYRGQLIAFQLADNTQTENTEYLEIVIEDLLLKGYSNWEIAGELDINIDTVRIYRMELIQRLGTKNSMLFARRSENEMCRLTPKEMQLLRLIAAGFTNREIADRLCLSEDTVKTDRRNLILKLGSESTMDMVMDALRQGLIKLEDIDDLLSNN